MRIALLAGSLVLAFAVPALAQLSPGSGTGQRNRPMTMGPAGMEQGPMAPGLPGQQNATLDSEPAGAGMGPASYADPSDQGRRAGEMTTGPGTGPNAPQGMRGPAMMRGGPNRQ